MDKKKLTQEEIEEIKKYCLSMKDQVAITRGQEGNVPTTKEGMENFIRKYTVDKKLCDNLIKYHKLNKEYKAEGETSRGVNKNVKDSIDVRFYNQSKDKTILQFFKVLSESVRKYLDEFNIEFPIITDTANLIQHYPKNGGYKVFHSENCTPTCSHRRLVYLLYLNNVPNGGTEFKYQNIITQAVKGNLLIWPAEFTHTHKGVISKTNEKYIVTGWFKMNLQNNGRIYC